MSSTLAEAPTQTEAFDASHYDDPGLVIAKVDGESIDRISITFTGTIFLDRSDKNDVALYNTLRFGKDVTLMVEGKCAGVGAKGVTDREGDLDVVVGQKKVKVHTVYRPADDTAGLVAVGTAGEDEPEEGEA